MNTNEFGLALKDIGVDYFSGVPCSYLSALINYAINNDRFIMANNEGDCIAIASGISLVGKNVGCVLMQNSGLSNALSPLTSLNYTFEIPILGFISLRGERDINGNNLDEPQHELLGEITDKILDICKIQYEFLSSDIKIAKAQLQKAKKILDSKQSFFFIIRNKTFDKVPLETFPKISKNDFKNILQENISFKPSRLEALNVIYDIASNCAILTTTGKCSREFYELGDRENHFYMVGSMGCVSSLCLGISLASDKKVIAVDGDSALLMRLGILSTNSFYAKKRNLGNFCHILLDNQSHDSTGGQFNLSPYVNFANIAQSCGYDVVNIAYSLDDLKRYLKDFIVSTLGGAHFIYLSIKKGSKENLGRPKITPKEVARRFSRFINLTEEV